SFLRVTSRVTTILENEVVDVGFLCSSAAVASGLVLKSSCLTTTDTKVPLKNLVSYTIQCKPLFSVDAARFLTIKRKIICSDPSSSWAKKAMNYLDEKNKKLQSVSNKTAH
uniref:Chemokine interleukin-8-like domain-containing protein n=1 Tax=Cyprinus carpio carpio TaxID=630221 RepID=A0A8C1DP62_CYPCA